MLVAALLSATALAAPPQQPAKPEEAAPVFPSGTQAVVLDVVARDKRGRTVSDLRPEEIEVLEEGKPKTITGFRFIERTPLPPPAAPGAPAPAPVAGAPRHPTLVTLVFDSLDQLGRPFARNAALELLRADERKDLLFSVFYVGNRLQLLQQFTTDRQALAAAVDRACSVLDPRGVVPGPETTDRVTTAANAANDRAQATGDAAMAGGGAAAGAAAGQAAAEAGMANMELRAVEMAQNLERSQRGNGSLFALFALARQQQRLAGRKAIVYFSEGLEVPNQLEPLYRSVVSESNRANLSVYSVDARGLLTTSDNEAARRDLRKSMETVRRQVQSRGGRAVTREDVLAGEVAEDAITQNVQGMLGALSESTGGRLIANSNDVRAGLDRALGDMAGYYEVTYDPQLTAFDGAFRRVSVKVRRPGVSVQSREGYFALPPGEGSVDFPGSCRCSRHSRPLRRRATSKPTRAPIASARSGARCATRWWPRSPWKGSRSRAGAGRARRTSRSWRWCATRRARFASTSARTLRGSAREETSRRSGAATPSSRAASPSSGPLLPRARRARPGGEARVGAQERPRGARPRARGSLLSSVAVVKRTEPVPEGALESSDPLRNGSNRIVPFVGEPTFQAGETVSLFLVAYPAGAGTVGLTLEFSREGAVVGRSSVELPAADSTGRIPYVASVPTQSLAPGRYEVSAVVRLGRGGGPRVGLLHDRATQGPPSRRVPEGSREQ